MRSAVTQSVQVLDRRLNALGTTEPSIQAEGSERILVQVPGLEDTAQLKQILGQTARMTFHMECTEQSTDGTTPPPGCERIESAQGDEAPMIVESRARADRRRPRRCAAFVPSADQRADRHVPLQHARRPHFRRSNASERGPAFRRRARRQIHHRSRHPRRDPRRLRPDRGTIHRRERAEPVGAASRRRASRRPDHRRGADRRPEPRAGFHPRRRHRSRRGARRGRSCS